MKGYQFHPALNLKLALKYTTLSEVPKIPKGLPGDWVAQLAELCEVDCVQLYAKLNANYVNKDAFIDGLKLIFCRLTKRFDSMLGAIDIKWRFTCGEHQGYTALHFTVVNSQYNLIHLLCINGADPSASFCGGGICNQVG